MPYAAETTVTPTQSLEHIRKCVADYGGDDFVNGESRRRGEAFVRFMCEDTTIRFAIQLPDVGSDAFTKTPGGKRDRSAKQARSAYEKEVRRMWRSLVLVIKALFVAVDDGVLEFKQAFMPYMLIDNQTVYDHARDRLDKAVGRDDQTGLLTWKQPK